METNLKVKDYKDGKLVRLSTNGRIRILNSFYALNFFAGAIAFALLFLFKWNESVAASTIAILGAIAFAIAFYRFINKATENEKIFVNKEKIELIDATLFNVNRRSFLNKDISDFKFLAAEKYETHPLKGETFDYLGFQTEQRVIQDLHSEGRASFIYQGRQVRFGKELASWEFSELEILLYDITGNDFRYTDKYEHENFPKE